MSGAFFTRHAVKLDRRRLLRVAGNLATAALTTPLASRLALGQPRFASYPFALGVASGDPVADGFVLWTRLAPDPAERRRHAARGGRGALGGGRGPALPRHRPPRHRARRTRARPRRACRRAGPRARPLVLLPLPRRRRGQPDRPHPHLPGPRHAQGPAALRLRLLPALRPGLLHRLRRHDGGRPRPDRPPRRLHLRERLGAEGPLPPARARRPCAATATMHALYKSRPRPAGGARLAPVPGDLGRPRGRQRLRRRASRRTATRPRRSCGAGRPPTRPITSTCRCGARRGRSAPTCGSTPAPASATSPPS